MAATVEILIQIREDLKGLLATNTALGKMRDDLAATGRAAKQSTAATGNDFSGLADKIKTKFSAKNLGLDVLRGIGIGSGFQVAAIAAGQIANYWKEAAESAQRILGFTERQLTAAQKLVSLRQTDDQRREVMLGEAARLQRELDNIQPTTRTRTMQGNIAGGTQVTETIPLSSAQKERRAELAAQIQELGLDIATIEKKIADDRATAAKQAADERTRIEKEGADAKAKEAERAAKLMLDKDEWVAQQRRDHDAALTREAEAVRAAIATPQEEHAQRLARLNTLYIEGKITVEEYGRAVGKSFADLDSKTTGKLSDSAREMGWAFQSAFENAILSGQKLGDVLRGLLRDIAQIALRTAVTQPLGAAVGGFFSKIFAAGGGNFVTHGPTQLTVGDNPGGMELVSVLPLSGVGNTSVSGSVARMAGGGSLLAGAGAGGRTINVTQNLNIATGVQGTVRAEIVSMLPMFRELARDSVREGVARGDL